MQFPIHVYKCPGQHPAKAKGGKTYKIKGVADAAEFDSAVASGWFVSYEEASGLVLKADADPVVVNDDSAPTRAELEQKARELNIKFDGRTRDHKLAALIKEAI